MRGWYISLELVAVGERSIGVGCGFLISGVELIETLNCRVIFSIAPYLKYK
jgi:hypothetical protein